MYKLFSAILDHVFFCGNLHFFLTLPLEAILLVLPLVDACRVVHGLHPAGADAPDVDLLLVPGEGGEAARAVGQVRHLVITRVTAERLQSDNNNIL